MGHGLTDADTMFSVREMPWHGLGAVLDEPPGSIEDAQAAPIYRPGRTGDDESAVPARERASRHRELRDAHNRPTRQRRRVAPCCWFRLSAELGRSGGEGGLPCMRGAVESFRQTGREEA
jgi:hypothetical protein